MNIEALDYNRIGTLVLDWYGENARVLLWRSDPTPYHVWISEIMLQQTRVEVVKEYYRRFLDALPDVQALAKCEERVYLKLWEGLGYYSRVRNLHKAAVQIIENYNGRIPSEPAELQKLPGIGEYTAGAIGSIAFGRPVAAVDGNVLRILSRLAADPSDIGDTPTKKRAQEAVTRFLEERMEGDAGADADAKSGADADAKPVEDADEPLLLFSPGAFNQALMDLGATVCLPNGVPKCQLCPVAECCKALELGLVDRLPVKAPKKERRIEERTVLILRMGDAVAIRRRPEKGLLAGLWEFPNVSGHLTMKDAEDLVQGLGFEAVKTEDLPDAKHVFTHVEWHMIGYSMELKENHLSEVSQREKAVEQGNAAQSNFVFVSPEELENRYPIPSAFSAYNHF